MATSFRIPRLNDREVIKALQKVRKNLEKVYPLNLRCEAPHIPINNVDINDDPEKKDDLARVLAVESVVIAKFILLFQGKRHALVVSRELDKPDDVVSLPDDWISNGGDEAQRVVQVLLPGLIAASRKELRASDIDAVLRGHDDHEWGRFRKAQLEVINSLQQAVETILVEAANRNSALDQQRSEQYAALEVQLRKRLSDEQNKLEQDHDRKLKEIEVREKEHADKVAEFQTKEARYVSRQKQDEQIKQIQAWLEDWGLTKGTTNKRVPITLAYIAALVITGGLTAYATSHNYELLKTTEDLAKLQWWHWLALASKAFFPLAAFTTFMVYFIRWSSAWAKQHSEEEFRNRSRLIDIGRSGWLLEAVRDAHEKNAEIPTDLLRELSRNLFSNASSSEADIHPSAISDVVLQGLTSLRVKTADGSEVEASRAKPKK
jgi:hypothetical protein